MGRGELDLKGFKLPARLKKALGPASNTSRILHTFDSRVLVVEARVENFSALTNYRVANAVDLKIHWLDDEPPPPPAAGAHPSFR